MTSAYAEIIPFSEYLADGSMNNSTLKEMGKSPKHLRAKELEQLDDNDSASKKLGRPTHTAVLEPEKFDDSVAVWKGGLTEAGKFSMRAGTNAHKEFVKAAKEQGREVLDLKTLNLCNSMRDAVRAHSRATELLTGGKAEVSIFWTHRSGVKCKIRVDMLHESFFVDFKTDKAPQPSKFWRAVTEYEYYIQGAFYQDGIEALTGKKLPFHIVAVESSAPYDVICYRVPQQLLDMGRFIYELRLERLVECRKTGRYPGHSDVSIDLPIPEFFYNNFMEKYMSQREPEFLGKGDISAL